MGSKKPRDQNNVCGEDLRTSGATGGLPFVAVIVECPRSFLAAYFSGPQSFGMYCDLVFFQIFVN